MGSLSLHIWMQKSFIVDEHGDNPCYVKEQDYIENFSPSARINRVIKTFKILVLWVKFNDL